MPGGLARDHAPDQRVSAPSRQKPKTRLLPLAPAKAACCMPTVA